MTTLTIKTTFKPKMTNWTKTDLNESGEGPPAAARHHVSVQAAQSTQCGLVTQLLGSKMIRFSRLNENKKKIFKCHGWCGFIIWGCFAMLSNRRVWCMLSAGRSVSEDQEHVKRSSCLDRLTATQHSLSSELDKDQKGIFAIQYKTFLMAYHFWNLILMRCSAQRRVEYTGGRGALKLNILILHWCTNIEYTGGCDALMICPPQRRVECTGGHGRCCWWRGTATWTRGTSRCCSEEKFWKVNFAFFQ